ncbi:unnamed protein product, partial [Polarella glacialis]
MPFPSMQAPDELHERMSWDILQGGYSVNHGQLGSDHKPVCLEAVLRIAKGTAEMRGASSELRSGEPTTSELGWSSESSAAPASPSAIRRSQATFLDEEDDLDEEFPAAALPEVAARGRASSMHQVLGEVVRRGSAALN